jgi:predicted O-methyltransferase YrrM
VLAPRRDRLKALAVRATAGAAGRLGLDVVPRGVYSPLATVPPEDDPAWLLPLDLPGLHLDLDAQLAFVRDSLAEPAAAFAVPPPFRLDNPFYGRGDAELLFAMLRWAAPGRVLELGSGWSTHTLRAAAPEADLVAVDPEPQTQLPAGVRHERADAAELPPERLSALEAGDILFVDTSHVVRRGGEVNRIVLGFLPRLRPGVLVHFHDVFLPYEYPRLFFQLGGHFSEQYLLAALLEGNADWEIVLAAHALYRDRHADLVAAIPALRDPGPVGPSALWLRRR